MNPSVTPYTIKESNKLYPKRYFLKMLDSGLKFCFKLGDTSLHASRANFSPT